MSNRSSLTRPSSSTSSTVWGNSSSRSKRLHKAPKPVGSTPCPRTNATRTAPMARALSEPSEAPRSARPAARRSRSAPDSSSDRRGLLEQGVGGRLSEERDAAGWQPQGPGLMLFGEQPGSRMVREQPRQGAIAAQPLGWQGNAEVASAAQASGPRDGGFGVAAAPGAELARGLSRRPRVEVPAQR